MNTHERGKSLDTQGIKGAKTKHPPVIVEEQLKTTGFQSGSINVGTMFREDQSETVTQGVGEIKSRGRSVRD